MMMKRMFNMFISEKLMSFNDRIIAYCYELTKFLIEKNDCLTVLLKIIFSIACESAFIKFRRTENGFIYFYCCLLFVRHLKCSTT